jgi:hypothetical protein
MHLTGSLIVCLREYLMLPFSDKKRRKIGEWNIYIPFTILLISSPVNPVSVSVLSKPLLPQLRSALVIVSAFGASNMPTKA